MPKPYYCTKCKRKHVRGKIYNEHRGYAKDGANETKIDTFTGRSQPATAMKTTRRDKSTSPSPKVYEMFESRLKTLESTVREIQKTVLFLREQWGEDRDHHKHRGYTDKELREEIRNQLVNIPRKWQSIEQVWNTLPPYLQDWPIFHAIIEELSDERVLNVSSGESEKQVRIRGERYGSVKRN
ncbi:hypothetical protein GF325_12545 [Candidatus Bathyarchaeota archaeon]|nr:hypothetical protein [Candidatus Bathyarchaeota archaeon]